MADTLDWGVRPATNLRTGATDTWTYGTAPAQISTVTSGTFTGTFDAGGPNLLAIEPASTSNGTTGYINSTINATVGDESTFHTTTITFTEPVYNASVVVGDIDGGPTFNLTGAAFNDIVEFRAVSATGATVLPTSATPAAAVTWNAATGRALSTNTNVTDLTGNVTVRFAGPIRSMSIRHIAGPNSTLANPTQQFIFIETVTYTRSPLLTVQKTSLNGTGTFTFDRSNSLSGGSGTWSGITASTSVTTVTAGTAVTGQPGILWATNTATTLTETAPVGWDITSSPATCTDSASATSGNPASFTATVANNVVTLAAANVRAGAVITCALTNNKRPVLTLVKTITNDNGGTAAATAFTLVATGPSSISGATASSSVTSVPVAPGTYALSETGPTGYTASAWTCTGGTLAGSNLTLAYGQTASCTINNNDIAPVLTLVKTVTDTSGGPSTVPSFTLRAAGPVTISGITGAAAITNATVTAGTYALSETGPTGYSAGAWSCSGGTLTGSSLALGVGQTVTCTINNVRLPTLTLRKISTGAVGSFNFTGTNGVPSQTLTTTAVATPVAGIAATLAAASTSTAITEVLPVGTPWQISSATCTGMGTGGTATLSGTTLTLDAAATAAGRAITCTITNQRRPMVSVQKSTTGGFGGPFSFSATNLDSTVANISTTAANTATPASPTRINVTNSSNPVTLTETLTPAWVSSGVVCTDVNAGLSGNTNPVATATGVAVSIPSARLLVGADIVCLYTNAAAAPSLSIVKTANTAGPVAKGAVITYTFRVKNTGNVPVSGISVNDVMNAYGTAVVPGSETQVTDAAPTGDSSDTISNGVWDVLGPGDEVVFSGPYTVVQGDIDNLQ